MLRHDNMTNTKRRQAKQADGLFGQVLFLIQVVRHRNVSSELRTLSKVIHTFIQKRLWLNDNNLTICSKAQLKPRARPLFNIP